MASVRGDTVMAIHFSAFIEQMYNTQSHKCIPFSQMLEAEVDFIHMKKLFIRKSFSLSPSKYVPLDLLEHWLCHFL